MTQKITSLLLLLVSCIFAANAQTIASEPTTDLKDGYYVIKLKSNDNKADENGNYMYYNADDSRVYYEEKGSTTQLIGTENTNADMMKYLFKVTKSGDKYTISAWGTSKFFPSIKRASASFYESKTHPGRQDQFTLSNSSAGFTPVATTGSWYAMKTAGTYYKNGVKNIDIYIILNDKQHIGYWENAANGANNAQFQFYAATNVPEASDIVTITYNYKLNDVVKGSYTTNMALIGKTFPTPKDVPAYVDFENFPTRNVTAEDNNQTFDLACTIATPFQISDDSKKYYYYLQNSNDTKTRIFANNGDMKFREDAQAENLNNVNGDLWYVTGNPFDGFQFHNVGANKTAISSQSPSNEGFPRCRLAFSGVAGSKDVWYIYKFDDNSFGLYRYSNWVIGSGNVAWNYNNEYVQFDKIDLNALPTEKSYAFTLTPATITLLLHNSAADNANFATTCLPYAVEVANAEGTVKTYAGKLNAEQTELEMNEVNAVPANQGIIIKGNTTDNEVEFRVIDAAETIDNDLQGTTEELTDLTGVYSFGRANRTGKVGFFRSTNPTLKANRAYIKLDNSASQSIAMNFDGNIVSSIESVNTNNATMSNAPVFDLTGRRVMKMVKGNLYIQNGRKFIAQ